MLILSFTPKAVLYAQVINVNQNLSIETLQKYPLDIDFTPRIIAEPDFESKLRFIIEAVVAKLPHSEKELALAFDTDWFDLKISEVDAGLLPENVEAILDSNAKILFSEWYATRYIQHYPLNIQGNKSNLFLTVAYLKKLNEALKSIGNALGLTLRLLDINIFDAANAVTDFYPELQNRVWGVWNVGSGKNEILIIEKGEVRQLIWFEFVGFQDYHVRYYASPDKKYAEVLEEINDFRLYKSNQLSTLDALFYYSNDVVDENFNIFMTFEIDNLVCLNPIDRIKPKEIYLGDGDGIGAMSQFSAIMGLILRMFPRKL